jgi:hypothetical protein
MVLLVLSIVPVTGIRDENLLLNRGNDDVLLNMLLRVASIETRVELLLVGELLLLRGLLLLLWGLLVLLGGERGLLWGLLVLLGRERGLLLHRRGGVLLELLRSRRPVGPGVDGGGHSGPRHSCRVGELRPDAAYLLQDRIVAGLWRLCLSRLGCWPLLLSLRDGCSLWLSDGAGYGW